VITVDYNEQQMTVAVDGQVKYRWPVSTGLPSYETPNGDFKAFRMEEDHYSKEWDDAPMPHSIFFTKRGHAIHGTDHMSRMGNPASHGCVRLSRQNAATLFALVKEQGVLNTTVSLTGSASTAIARRKGNVETASRGGARVTSGDAVTPQAPRQLAPQQGYRGDYDDRQYAGDVVYGVDQWGRTVMIRRDPRAARRTYEAQPYEARPYYAPQPYGYRDPYYVPRRGLFGGETF
jgi:hypothetical protein